MSLRTAQHIEATNWVAAYRTYLGSPPASAPVAHHTPQKAVVKPPHTSKGSCEPGYSPCLPVADDLDCGDLSATERPVRVTGSDPFGLDADGDGIGCDS